MWRERETETERQRDQLEMRRHGEKITGEPQTRWTPENQSSRRDRGQRRNRLRLMRCIIGHRGKALNRRPASVSVPMPFVFDIFSFFFATNQLCLTLDRSKCLMTKCTGRNSDGDVGSSACFF